LITAMGANPSAEPVVKFAPEGFACTIRVPLDTIRPSRYDRASPILARETGALAARPSASDEPSAHASYGAAGKS
jgi:hypothetical protein